MNRYRSTLIHEETTQCKWKYKNKPNSVTNSFAKIPLVHFG